MHTCLSLSSLSVKHKWCNCRERKWLFLTALFLCVFTIRSLIWHCFIILCCVFHLVHLHNSHCLLSWPPHTLHLPQKQTIKATLCPCLHCPLLFCFLRLSPYLLIDVTTWKVILPKNLTTNITLYSLYISCFLLLTREFLVRASTTSEVSLRSLWSPAVTCRSSLAPSSLRLRYSANRTRHNSQ